MCWLGLFLPLLVLYYIQTIKQELVTRETDAQNQRKREIVMWWGRKRKDADNESHKLELEKETRKREKQVEYLSYGEKILNVSFVLSESTV